MTLQERSLAWDVTTSDSGRSMMFGIRSISVRLRGPRGALRAFYRAGKLAVRGIRVTGHHDPAVLIHAVTHWDIDSVLLPVSPVEAGYGGFSDQVIPAARERGIGIIGMKFWVRKLYPSRVGSVPGDLDTGLHSHRTWIS